MRVDAIVSLFFGGAGGALVVWLLRNWFLERLRRSIEHEYASKLETHKAELKSKLASMSYGYQADQLKTSLFFDHQRAAFGTILSAAVEMRDQWVDAYDPETQRVGAVPSAAFKKLRSVFYAQQLFLDRASVAAVELLLSTAQRSFPFVDHTGEHPVDGDAPLEQVDYILPLLADVFRDRLGLEPSDQADRKLALLGGIQLVNRYHFPDIKFPVKGELELSGDRAADAVEKAHRHSTQLIAKLREFRSYLVERNLGVFHEASTDVNRYIEILEQSEPAEITSDSSIRS